MLITIILWLNLQLWLTNNMWICGRTRTRWAGIIVLNKAFWNVFKLWRKKVSSESQQNLNPNKKLTTTVQKIKFSIKDFFNKCDQIRSFLLIWSHLLKKSLMENFIFCAVWVWTSVLEKFSNQKFMINPVKCFGKIG